jgi:Terminase small subunit
MRSDGLRSGKRPALTEKQRRFVTAFIETLDVHAAALQAGYSKRHAKAVGVRLLGQRRIIEAIARRPKAGQGVGDHRTAQPITKGWITDELAELYRAVKACLPTAGGDDGKAPSGASLQSAIKMLELLIKHIEDEGLHRMEDQADSEPDLSRLDRDELRRLEAILARTVPETSPTGARGA